MECFTRVVPSPRNTKAQVLLQERSALIDRVINEYSGQPPKFASINVHIEIQLLNFNSKIQQHPSHLNRPLRFTMISISIVFPPQRPASINIYPRERRNLPLMPGILHSGQWLFLHCFCNLPILSCLTYLIISATTRVSTTIMIAPGGIATPKAI